MTTRQQRPLACCLPVFNRAPYERDRRECGSRGSLGDIGLGWLGVALRPGGKQLGGIFGHACQFLNYLA